MERIIRFLAQKSSEYELIDYNRFFFSFPSFYILIIFSSDKRDLAEEFYDFELRDSDLNHLPLNYLKELEVSDIVITDCEYLGDRNFHSIDKVIKSISFKMFALIRAISEINESVICSYNLDLNEGYTEGMDMCEGEPNYIFNIFLRKEVLLNDKILDEITSLNVEDVSIPTFYQSYFNDFEKIDDSKEVLILNTSTKVRRLGYLKIFSQLLFETPKIPSFKINNRLEDYSNNYSAVLDEHKNSKGVIQKTRTGNSAKPYINLFSELGLINNINNIQSAGKLLKVYQALSTNLTKNNSFILNRVDKIFFLEILLRKDFLYITLILELLYIKVADNYSDLKNKFHQLLIKRLGQFIQNTPNNTKEYKNIKVILERITNWENPNVYLEHVLMPRLNWLYDLELISMDNSINVTLCESGSTLFKNFNFWNDVNYEWVLNPNEFLNKFYIQVYQSTYKEDSNTSHELEFIISRIKFYINESFLLFKTLAPNRVTASQAITFTKYKLYIVDNICVSDFFIKKFLLNEGNQHFIYKYQKQFGDGYIQKILK